MFYRKVQAANCLLVKIFRPRIISKRLVSNSRSACLQKSSTLAAMTEERYPTSTHLLDHTQQPRTFVKIFGILNSYIDSMVVFSGVSLGIFDYLSSQTEHVSAKLVANHIGGEEKATKLVLDYLVSLDLLTKHDTNGGGCSYCLTDVSEAYLTLQGDNTLNPLVKILHKVSYPAFSNLKSAVTDDKFPASRTKDNDFPSETFLKVADAFHAICSPVVAKAFDLSQYSLALHIGGGRETLASELCSAYPHMTISVLRLPLSSESNHLELCKLREKTKGRLNFAELNYLRDDLPKCDLVVLSPLVWGWPKEKLNDLLGKVNRAAGAVLTTAENLMERNEFPPIWKLQRSLLQISLGGSNEIEPNTDSVKEQLIRAGFNNIQVKNSSDSVVDAVMGKLQ